MKKYIVSYPNILNGKPVITGTRIPIAQILFLLKEDYSIKDIHDEYPNVSVKKLQGVIDELTTDIENTTHGSQILQI